MKQAFNPYLPFWETVPDGEPHVFGDRVYVYGSHDKRGGGEYCMEDYVCWSASVSNLADWKCEGVIYKKEQDPINGGAYNKPLPRFEGDDKKGILHYLYAPDVAKGHDGRYYLYYALDSCDIISVAVADNPAGPFEFLDYVLCQDVQSPKIGRKFDPAILVESDGNYLYYGFCPSAVFEGMAAQPKPGLMLVELADDMHTVISEPVVIANGVDTAAGTSFEAHPAFEGPSIRHIGEWYYFVYSSLQGHELCYAMSKSPKGPFEYKGILVSNGDLGYRGRIIPSAYWGNNHGGLEQIGDKTYIFYHRQTHGTEYSRQGCAEEVHIKSDGTVDQVEMTSCGLNGGPLKANHIYDTYIACNLTGRSITDANIYSQVNGLPGHVISRLPWDEKPLVIPEDMPYITEEECATGQCGLKPFICQMAEGAVAGFKYFEFSGENMASLELRGLGDVAIYLDGSEVREIGKIHVDSSDWKTYEIKMDSISEVHSVFVNTIIGKVDFARIGFTKQ